MKTNFDFSQDGLRKLLYRERLSLDDFNVEEVGSLNYAIYDILYSKYSHLTNFEEFVLGFFNHAYYICTVALADSHPDRRIGVFEERASSYMHHNMEYATTILSIALLQIRAHKWDENPPMKRMAEALDWYIHDNCEAVYYELFTPCQTLITKSERKLSPESEFSPRDITSDLLKDIGIVQLSQNFGPQDDGMRNFVFAIGKNEEELMLLVKFLRKETRAANIDDAKHNAYFDEIEDEILTIYHSPEEKSKIRKERENARAEKNKLQEIETGIEPEVSDPEKIAMQKRIEELENALRDYKNRQQNRGGINQIQTAYLGKKIFHELSVDVSNAKLAKALSKISGWGERKLDQCLSSDISEEEEQEVLDILSELDRGLALRVKNLDWRSISKKSSTT